VPIVEVDTKPVVTKGRKKPVKVAPASPPQPPIEMLEGWAALHSKFREDTYNFIETKIVKAMADQRLRRGLPPAEDAQDAENYSLDASDRTYLPAQSTQLLTSSCCPTGHRERKQGNGRPDPHFP